MKIRAGSSSERATRRRCRIALVGGMVAVPRARGVWWIGLQPTDAALGESIHDDPTGDFVDVESRSHDVDSIRHDGAADADRDGRCVDDEQGADHHDDHRGAHDDDDGTPDDHHDPGADHDDHRGATTTTAPPPRPTTADEGRLRTILLLPQQEDTATTAETSETSDAWIWVLLIVLLVLLGIAVRDARPSSSCGSAPASALARRERQDPRTRDDTAALLAEATAAPP